MRFFLSRFFLILCLVSNAPAFGDNLENMISNLITDKLGENISNIELSLDYKSQIIFSKIKDQNIKNVQLTYFAPNLSSFRVIVTAENEESFDLFGRYNAYIDTPITTKTLAAGTIITESEVSSIRSLASKIRSGYISSMNELIGMQVKRTLAPGVLVRRTDVVKPQVVRQGDNVEMIYVSGNIKLRTNGIALQSGAVGDTVRVKNETTNTVVYGEIKAKNLVEVGGK